MLAAACATSSKPPSSGAPPAAAGSTATTSGSGTPTGVAAAQAAIAPYEGHPSSFTVTEPLTKRPAPGSRFVYLQCSTPTCAQIGQTLIAPTKALGVTLSVVNSGSTSTSVQAAAATVLAEKPAAVLLSAVDPQLFGGALHQLTDAGVAVTAVGIINGEPYGVQATVGGSSSSELDGKLMADWVTVHKGAQANVVFFGTPELSFSSFIQSGFKDELARNCSTCQSALEQISVRTFGNTAPATVISYLQGHPNTNTVVFASMEAATGLAAAVKVAGINGLTTLGFAPSPSNLQDIKTGGLTAGLGLDVPVRAWTHVDITARLLAHQPIAPTELSAIDLQFLTQKDITFDTTHGWTGYPDVAQRFATLWPS
ncbi:MAG: hypothetical protein NVS3B21_11400 [Acidimicrobiales bacterium]